MDLPITKLLILCSVFVTQAIFGSDNNIGSGKITGKDIYDMGVKYNKPMLRLFGKALKDVAYHGPVCSPWTEWSACDVFVGPFGMRKRSRVCEDSEGHQSGSGQSNETDTVVCQAHVTCPSNYEMTEQGFCLQLYKIGKSKPDAEMHCQNDNGHLININSPKKWEAFASYLNKTHPEGQPYIDGQRKDISSPWTFTYETYFRGYTNWADNEPSNGADELCLTGATVSSKAGIHTYRCNDNPKWFVCEWKYIWMA